ncbi:MAG: FtsX-like permease family protein, partial [Phycisphaerales bacterium]|nr:FtsX-like permease family protein [Phycisphaerales bacterium]
RHRGFQVEPNSEMIVPSRQFQQFGGMTLVLRSTLDAVALESTIKREVRQMDPDQPVYRPRTMEGFLSDSVAQPRFTTMLLASFAFLAIALAIVGIYGVMSYMVTQRTREIGIRIALGAAREHVIRMVVRQGLALAAIGVAAGLAGAAVITRLMQGLLFGVTARDPVTYLVAAAALTFAAVAATYIPALRATHVDPLKALRYE